MGRATWQFGKVSGNLREYQANDMGNGTSSMKCQNPITKTDHMKSLNHVSQRKKLIVRICPQCERRAKRNLLLLETVASASKITATYAELLALTMFALEHVRLFLHQLF